MRYRYNCDTEFSQSIYWFMRYGSKIYSIQSLYLQLSLYLSNHETCECILDMTDTFERFRIFPYWKVLPNLKGRLVKSILTDLHYLLSEAIFHSRCNVWVRSCFDKKGWLTNSFECFRFFLFLACNLQNSRVPLEFSVWSMTTLGLLFPFHKYRVKLFMSIRTIVLTAFKFN